MSGLACSSSDPGEQDRSRAFFSKKLELAQVKYSAFDRELVACFRYMLEG
jgi:hypothetical protein